eukprot:1171906-Prymnesium_polylepis.1
MRAVRSRWVPAVIVVSGEQRGAEGLRNEGNRNGRGEAAVQHAIGTNVNAADLMAVLTGHNLTGDP